MNKKMKMFDFYRFIDAGAVQGACRYSEYWFIYKNLPKEKTRSLELGVGCSVLSWAVAELGNKVTVTETDDKNIEFQNNFKEALKNGKKIEYNIVKVNDLDLPFKDKSFDFVILASAIEHFKDDVKTMNEVYRVLDVGGLLALTVPVGNKYIENRHEGKKHPAERVYDEDRFEKVFLKDFEIVDMEFYKWSEKKPKDFIPHKAWGKRVNFEEVQSFSKADWLCAILKKK